MNETPWGYDAPERQAEQAASHWCKTVGSTVFCEKLDCPYCRPNGEGE